MDIFQRPRPSLQWVFNSYILDNRLHTMEFYLLVGPNFIITARPERFPSLEPAPHLVYELLRDIMKLQRSVHPFPGILNDLREGLTGKLDTHLRSLEDRALRLSGQVDSFRDALTAGLQLHTALLGQRQNDQMVRMSEAAYDQGEQAKMSRRGLPSYSPPR